MWRFEVAPLFNWFIRSESFNYCCGDIVRYILKIPSVCAMFVRPSFTYYFTYYVPDFAQRHLCRRRAVIVMALLSVVIVLYCFNTNYIKLNKT